MLFFHVGEMLALKVGHLIQPFVNSLASNQFKTLKAAINKTVPHCSL